MRAAIAILIAFLAGGCFAGIDLLATLTPWNHAVAQVVYYASLDGLVVLVAFLLARGQKKWWLTLLLFLAVFFAIEGYWNALWGAIAWATGTLHFPLNLGMGQYASADQYFLGIILDITLAFLLYIAYRLEAPQ